LCKKCNSWKYTACTVWGMSGLKNGWWTGNTSCTDLMITLHGMLTWYIAAHSCLIGSETNNLILQRIWIPQKWELHLDPSCWYITHLCCGSCFISLTVCPGVWTDTDTWGGCCWCWYSCCNWCLAGLLCSSPSLSPTVTHDMTFFRCLADTPLDGVDWELQYSKNKNLLYLV
jgi:hypothetical protein